MRRLRKAASSEDSSLTVEHGLLMAVMFLAFALTVEAAQPAWWTAPGGPLNSSPANDFAVANQGQLKQFTQKAVLYMDTNLPGGAGTTLDALVAGWSNYYATNGYSSTNPAPADLKAVNEGQLKYITHLVYPVLASAGYMSTNYPPWTQTNASDYKAANLGQLKTVFNFDLLVDSDTNGIPDWWETEYFGGTGVTTGYTTNSSPDGNGLTLLQDYQQGNNPTNYYSQGGTIITPTIAIVSGNNQSSVPGTFAPSPLVVKVTNSSGGATLTNAPVTFNLVSGSTGGLASTSGGYTASSISLLTDNSGQAQAYYQQPTGANVTNIITAGNASQAISFSEMTAIDNGSLTAPTGIDAEPNGPGTMNVTWINHDTSADFILLQQSTDGVNWTTIATLTDITTTSYTTTGLTQGQSYYFRVAAGKN